jgi:hypothetical protein
MKSESKKSSAAITGIGAQNALQARVPGFVMDELGRGKNVQVVFTQDVPSIQAGVPPLIQAGLIYHVIRAEATSFQVALRPGGPAVAIHQVASFESAALNAEFQAAPEYMRLAAVLSCMPAAHPDTEIPSVLDSYFDYHVPLSNLCCQLQQGKKDTDIFNDQGSSSRVQVASVSFRERFQAERRYFNSQLSSLQHLLHEEPPRPPAKGRENETDDHPYFCQSNLFSLDSTSSQHRDPNTDTPRPKEDKSPQPNQDTSRPKEYKPPQVWMGLSPVNRIRSGSCVVQYRKPVAFKAGLPADGGRMSDFESLMRQLRPGSYISSATKEPGIILATQAPLAAGGAASPGRAPDKLGPWMSEAGICTLQTLFGKVIGSDERNTLAFRDLLREVCVCVCVCVCV